MQNVFCVILSKYRIYQGLALYRSIAYNYSNFTVFILCVDDEAYNMCQRLRLDNVIIMRDSDLNDPRLAAAKQSRRLNEYCWTLKPLFLLHVLRIFDFVDNAVSLDADICFFDDPAPIFANQRNYTVLLSEHDYLDKSASVEHTCGRYNSGFIVFKRCQTTFELLSWWGDRCIEWCYDRADNGRFGDQKYLEQFQSLFQGVQTITTPGVNVAPWNDGKYRFHIKGTKVHVNNDRLICYHFCGLRLINKNTYALLMGSQRQINEIHIPYTLVLQEAISSVERISPGFNGYYVEDHFKNRAKLYTIGR